MLPASPPNFDPPRITRLLGGLPCAARRGSKLANKAFALLKADAHHPSVRLKKVGSYWSARVGAHYRPLAVEAEDGLVWFWIGHHAD